MQQFDRSQDPIHRGAHTATGVSRIRGHRTDLSRPTWRETFLRPKSGFGALFQFVDSNLDWGTPVPGITEEAVLSGKVVWKDNRPVLRGSAG